MFNTQPGQLAHHVYTDFTCRYSFSGDRYIYTHRGLLIHDLEKGDAGRYLCEARVATKGRYNAREISLYVDG